MSIQPISNVFSKDKNSDFKFSWCFCGAGFVVIGSFRISLNGSFLKMHMKLLKNLRLPAVFMSLSSSCYKYCSDPTPPVQHFQLKKVPVKLI